MPNERLIDPLVSLSFSVYSNKGVYALLLGSGISRAAGIPTGWEVVIDLIHIVAKLEGEDCEPDPAGWYRTKHSKEPDYSKLLDEIVKTPTERQQLLRRYFEPTDEERNQGVKLPTKAHRAIAQLASAGYIRVIITTNFDRLTERALEDAGITPTVISTTDLLTGALPLAHSGVTVIKLHGDYLDTRIRNTENELATYDKEMDAMLDRVLDEYGLIVCGWSGEWDTALRNAIARCPTRRFTTYWAAISDLTAKAQELTNCRRAVVLQTIDADHFFESALDKVQSLVDMASPHPLSAKIALATVKRHLADTSIIRFTDFIKGETESLIASVLRQNIPDQPSGELAERLVLNYDQMSASLLSVFIASAYWGKPEHAVPLISCLERLGNLCLQSQQQPPSWYKYRQYPSILMLYGAGIAAVTSGNFQILWDILTKPMVRGRCWQDEPFYSYMNPDSVIENGFGFPQRGYPYFVSNYLKSHLREPLFEYIASDRNYNLAFARFEYLWTLIIAYKTGSENLYVSPFGWAARGNLRSRDMSIMQVVDLELEAEGKDWGPLRAGLFNGSLEALKQAKTLVDETAKRQFQSML